MSKDKVLAKDGLFDPGLMSNLMTTIDGVLIAHGQTYLEIQSECQRKLITAHFDTKELYYHLAINVLEPDYTDKDMLALEGFASRYGFTLIERYDECMSRTWKIKRQKEIDELEGEAS